MKKNKSNREVPKDTGKVSQKQRDNRNTPKIRVQEVYWLRKMMQNHIINIYSPSEGNEKIFRSTIRKFGKHTKNLRK